MKAFCIAILLGLTACGGAPKTAAPAAQDKFSDPQLQTLWEQAQNTLATQMITLNAAYVAEGREAAVVIAPDYRALSVSPAGVSVNPVPDLTVAQLQSENPGAQLQHNTDPTGVIHAPAGSSASYCASYTQGSAVYVSASLEYSAGATGYEFQNVILERLGYDVSKR